MLIEPFALLIALLPLIAYLTVLGTLRATGQALVTTGGRDLAALAVAISGFVAVGPAELFFPNAAATVFGPLVWLALITFYALIVTLIALTSKTKLVVIGRTAPDLYAPLLAVAKIIDPDAEGDESSLQVHLVSLGIHLRLDGHRGIDHTQIISFESNISNRFWSQLLILLRQQVAELPPPTPRRGGFMLLTAALLTAVILWQGLGNPDQVVEGFRDWLWR